MKFKTKQSGITLPEIIVVVVVIALLIGLAIPAVKSFQNVLSSPGGAKAMISAALSSARALAAKHQKYAGIRFQQDKDGNQYMIPIIHDPNLVDSSTYTVPNSGFRALKGLNPMKIPSDIIVFGPVLTTNTDWNNDDKIKNLTTFSIIFSPSGSLVIRSVEVLRINSKDTIFNDSGNNPAPMFQDDYDTSFPYDKEDSVNNFVICNKNDFGKIDINSRYTDFIQDLEVLYINPYTGSIIEK